MENNQVIRVPAGRVIGSAIVALLVGAILPVVAFFQVSMLVPVLMLGGMLAVWLRAKAGWVPAGVLVAAATASTAWFVGVSVALMLFAAAFAPTIPVIVGMTRKRPFFEQMRGGVLAFIAGLIAAILIAYVNFGSGMIGQFVDILRAEYDQMPDSALMPFVEWANSMLSASGALGVSTRTVETFRGQLTGILDLMQQTYSQDSFKKWMRSAGVDETKLDAGGYAFCTAEDLTRLWLQDYLYFEENENGEIVGKWFESPNVSAIRTTVQVGTVTRSKAGWIVGQEAGYTSSVDAGIVYEEGHPYILAMMSDYPADVIRLEQYASLLEQIHAVLTGQAGGS